MAVQEKIKYRNIKNQITLEIELKKYKDTEIEFLLSILIQQQKEW